MTGSIVHEGQRSESAAQPRQKRDGGVKESAHPGGATTMSEPKTLLEMAGAPNRPHALAESAVVMIDVAQLTG